jgi:hypothetical protein
VAAPIPATTAYTGPGIPANTPATFPKPEVILAAAPVALVFTVSKAFFTPSVFKVLKN